METVSVEDDDYGVPFPGVVLPPERRRDATARLERGQPLDWSALFAGPAPEPGAPEPGPPAPHAADVRRVVDLGCGNGRYLLASALARPEVLHLGVDLVPQAIQHAARRAGERGLANVKYAWGDALRLLFEGLTPRSIDELHVYHPQPYYDPEQVGRRMLHPPFFGQAWRVLREGGLLVLQTDNPAYARYVARTAPRFFEWREHPGPWPDAPLGRTRREIKALQLGLPLYRASGAPLPLSERRLKSLVRHVPRPDFDANRAVFRKRGGPQRRRGGGR
ncbi:MAG: tRNA (guanosine(46)-N(7))-methyltransferase TrmB [Planctomycetota bacterium]